MTRSAPLAILLTALASGPAAAGDFETQTDGRGDANVLKAAAERIAPELGELRTGLSLQPPSPFGDWDRKREQKRSSMSEPRRLLGTII